MWDNLNSMIDHHFLSRSLPKIHIPLFGVKFIDSMTMDYEKIAFQRARVRFFDLLKPGKDKTCCGI